MNSAFYIFTGAVLLIALFYYKMKSDRLNRINNDLSNELNKAVSALKGIEKDAKEWQKIKNAINNSNDDAITEQLRKHGWHID